MRYSFEFCLLWNFLTIKHCWHPCSVSDKLGWLHWFWQFLFERLFSLMWQDSLTHIHGLLAYVREGLRFAWDLSLTLLLSVSYFFFSYQSPSSCTVFDAILSNIDEVLSINLSAYMFVFGDFNIHHKDWLTYSRGTDRPGEVGYNFWYLLKCGTTWNDMRRPTMIWIDLQRAKNDLKRPTTRKKQPTTIWITTSKKGREAINNKQILRLFYSMEQSVPFSNTVSNHSNYNHSRIVSWRIMVKIEP